MEKLHEYRSPAVEVVGIESENYCFSVSGGDSGDGMGTADNWPSIFQ